MERVAFKMKLFAGREAEYQQRHTDIWPELAELLVAYGIRDYSIWHDPETDILFGTHLKTDKNRLDELFAHTEWALSDHGELDVVAYRRRIDQVDSARHNLASSVERLADLIDVGADTLLITIGQSVCQVLLRILESANAHAYAIEDGA